MKVAVVGHLEWGMFMRVQHVPEAGEIIHADETWEEVAGGGAVAAMQLAALNGSCTFFTAVGNDDLGKRAIEQLQQNGVEVYASVNDKPTKSIMVHIDKELERTITVTGDLKPSGGDSTLPWEKLADMDAIYFVSGDIAALKKARIARNLISTARALPLLQQAAVQIDVLLSSEKDASEVYRAGDLSPEPTLVVTTRGARGGILSDGSSYEAEFIDPKLIIDTYGCGDSFAAAFTYGLATSSSIQEALNIAAHVGATAAQRRGAFGN